MKMARRIEGESPRTAGDFHNDLDKISRLIGALQASLKRIGPGTTLLNTKHEAKRPGAQIEGGTCAESVWTPGETITAADFAEALRKIERWIGSMRDVFGQLDQRKKL
jgi:hypothetical protein